VRCVAVSPQKVQPAAPPAATTCAAAAGCVVNGNDESVIDLTESDDEAVAVATASAAAACARTNGFMSKSPQPAHSNVSHSTFSRGTLSSPSPPGAVFDLSPLHIPVSSSPVVRHNLPPSPLMVPTPPLLPPPSLGPSSFHPAFPTPSAKMSSIPFLGGSSSSSSSSSAYSTLPSAASAAASLHYPTNSLFTRSPYDSDAMLDFLTLMSGFSDFGGYSLSPNAFDYLYQSSATNSASLGAAVDFGLDSVVHGSPSPTI